MSIIITLKNNPSKTEVTPDRTKQGIIPVSYQPKHLARRISAAGIEIVDLGYLKGSPDFDLPFVSAPDLADSYAEPLRNVNEDDYETLRSYLFGLSDLNGLSSTFVPITQSKGDTYNLTVFNGTFGEALNSSSEYWVNNKINLPNDFLSGSKFEVNCPNNFFESFNLKGTNRNKITLTADFAADDFPDFVPNKNMTIYWLPVLNISTSIADKTVAGDLRKYRLNYFYTIFNRAKFFNPDDPLYGFVTDKFWFYAISSSTDYAEVFQSIAVQLAKPSPRAFYNSLSNPTITPIDVADYPPLPEYPVPPTVPETGSISATLSKAVRGDGKIPAEALIAIIKQGANYFYIWRETI